MQIHHHRGFLEVRVLLMIDTHAHMADPAFDKDREEVLRRAKESGVSAVVSVSETLEEAGRNLELAALFPVLRPAAGLYPTHLSLDHADEMAALIRREHRRLAAIGEVGLDHWAVTEKSDRTLQREIFSRFVRLSLELGLPLNVHSRSAGKHAVAVLLEQGAQKVQLHAFDGKWGSAMPAAAAGYFFSIPPSVVRSRQKQKLVKQLPLSAILVETDSPVLGSAPRERNEPSRIWTAVSAISEIKGISEEETARALSENTRNLYGDLSVA